jgi:hypothetical protein
MITGPYLSPTPGIERKTPPRKHPVFRAYFQQMIAKCSPKDFEIGMILAGSRPSIELAKHYTWNEDGLSL